MSHYLLTVNGSYLYPLVFPPICLSPISPLRYISLYIMVIFSHLPVASTNTVWSSSIYPVFLCYPLLLISNIQHCLPLPFCSHYLRCSFDPSSLLLHPQQPIPGFDLCCVPLRLTWSNYHQVGSLLTIQILPAAP